MQYWRTLFLLSAPLLALTAASGCKQSAEGKVDAPPPQVEAAAPFLVPVHAEMPVRGEIASYFETTARVEAERRVELFTKGTGRCLEVWAEVGDRVTAGQTLAQLEREELEAQVRQARISAQQQKTAFEIAERSLAEGIGAPVERDNAHFAYEQATAALDLHEIQLRNQTIQAPIGGIVTQRMIQPGLMATPGMPVFTLVDPGSYVLPIHVPEKELSRLHIGQLAEVRIDSLPDAAFKAHVRRIYPSVDPMSGTVRVLLDFEEEAKERLRESSFARVRLVMETRPQALIIPRDAVLEEDGRKYVFLLERQETSDAESDNAEARPTYTAHRVEITTGIEQNDIVEAAAGIADDALIVVMGQHSLKPEASVVVTNLEKELAMRASMTLDEALEAGKASQGVSANATQGARVSVQF